MTVPDNFPPAQPPKRPETDAEKEFTEEGAPPPGKVSGDTSPSPPPPRPRAEGEAPRRLHGTLTMPRPSASGRARAG